MREQAEKLEGVVRLFVIAEGNTNNFHQQQSQYAQTKIQRTPATPVARLR
jgi:hypothetical protein